MFHSPPKFGKTTFASQAPNPAFIPTEKGFGKIKDANVMAFPVCETFNDVRKYIGALATEKHDRETAVIDTFDGMETLLAKYTCEKHGETDIAPKVGKFAFGRGFSQFASEELRALLEGFDALRERGMAVILLVHSDVVRYESPEVDPYDRYQARSNKHLRALAEDWCDTILCGAFKVRTKKEGEHFGKQRSRGIGDGERVIYTEGRPAWVAGNRWGLPAELPLSWIAFSEAMAEAINPTTNPEPDTEN